LLPPAERGVQPRTFPAGEMEDAVNKGWYDPNRVYIMWSAVGGCLSARWRPVKLRAMRTVVASNCCQSSTEMPES
jgi:hypothetical protein